MDVYAPVDETQLTRQYEEARERYAGVGVDPEAALQKAAAVPISLHCWQADDVSGLETREEAVEGGGIMATGNYPGRADNGDELRADFETVVKLLPGVQRINLHAFYAETGDQVVERDALEPEHFSRWMDWSTSERLSLDFNPTYFAHPQANDGFTLSHADAGIRRFWIDHGVASRRVAEQIAKNQGSECINNHWIPDGSKDSPADRWGPRERLVAAYDEIFGDSHGIDTSLCVDAVESKLFGLASEDYVVGSMEFYTAYSVSRKVMQCLDMGHFHPTETIHDKISSLLQFQDRILLHTSRPVRWDSDHVVIFNDDVRQVFLEVIRGTALDRVAVALDFFDASINRIAAYIIGARATRKAILAALLDPTPVLQQLEAEGKGAQKLALMEEMKTLPFGMVWDMLCHREGVPTGASWIPAVEDYEKSVLSKRS
jgi:L-rhamnose isomerase